MSTFVPFPEDRGVEPLKEVLSRVMLQRGWGKVSAHARLEAAWKTVVGSPWDGLSQVVAFKRGMLEIRVTDALTHQHLVMMQSKLMNDMQKQLGTSIQSIRMRVG